MRRGTLFAILVLAVACSSRIPASDPDGTWVGTISTEGDVTTVVNESGSVWGGTGTLVEEASIGVEAGADEYMFGRINALYASDERIYVIDAQVPTVRMYDHAGAFLGDVGQQGQGPGEYTNPVLLAGDGERLFVLASDLRRINVYTASGEPLEEWPVPNRWCCLWPMFVLAPDALWVPVREFTQEEPGLTYGGQRVGAEGPYGEAILIPEQPYEAARFTVGERRFSAPFAPANTWNTVAAGIVTGTSDRYRFEVRRGDGSRLVVQRAWEPSPIPAERREYERRYKVSAERANGNADFRWDGAEMPDHMSAFEWFIPVRSGGLWIYRYGDSMKLPDCVEDPLAGPHDEARAKRCWDQQVIVDAFAADGRYLGEVEVAPGMGEEPLLLYLLFVDGDRVLATTQDAAGTIMVKRYRLVLPGEAEPRALFLDRMSDDMPPIDNQ